MRLSTLLLVGGFIAAVTLLTLLAYVRLAPLRSPYELVSQPGVVVVEQACHQPKHRPRKGRINVTRHLPSKLLKRIRSSCAQHVPEIADLYFIGRAG